MGTITRIEIASGTREKGASILHLQKLSRAMNPDPTEWEFTGIVEDDPDMATVCACGHPIRYVFVIERKRDGKRLNIGSTCIVASVPYLVGHGASHLAGALETANDEFLRALRKKRKEAREKRMDADADRILCHAKGLHAWYTALWDSVLARCAEQNISRPPYRPDYFYRGQVNQLLKAEPYLGRLERAKVYRARIETFLQEALVLRRSLERAGLGYLWTQMPVADE